MDSKGCHSSGGIAVLAEEFLADLAYRRYSPRTLAIYRLALADFDRFLGTTGVGRVQDVTGSVVEDYRRHLQGRQFSPAGEESYTRAVKRFFDYLEGKQRVVPIGRTALKLMESYLKGVRPFLLRDPAEKAFFLDEQGKRLPYYTLRRLVHACAKRAGVAINVTPHTFRRSCATELIRGGAGLYQVKELLGHERLDTIQHYARLTINDLKKEHQRCHPREKDANDR